MLWSRLRPWLLAASAGLLLGLALPGAGLAALVLAVPGLLRRSLDGAGAGRAWLLGWLGGWVQWMVAVPWIVIVLHRYGHLPLAVAVLALMLMCAILGLTWAVAAWATRRVPHGWRVWVLPLALAAMEVWQAHPPWGFPWNPVSAVAVAWPAVLPSVAVVGSAGLSLLLLLTGAGLDALLSRGVRRVGVVTAAVGALGIAGAVATAPPFRPAGPAVSVAALQPDVPLEVRWDPDNLKRIESRVWALTGEAADRGARWIVWPESAIPLLVERDREHRERLVSFARERDVWLTVGSIGLGPGDAYYNSIFTVAPQGLSAVRYDKIHLVPFGEYVPVVGNIAFLRPLVHEVGSFTPGTDPAPVAGPAGRTGLAVCYEVAFPSLIAAEVRRGAEVLATITNDGWYGDSAAPRQHLALARLRAAEACRFMVRAANTGISAVISPAGGLTETLGVGRRGMVLADVLPGRGVTPAAAYGGVMRSLLVLLAAGAILVGARRQTSERTSLHGGSPRSGS